MAAKAAAPFVPLDQVPEGQLPSEYTRVLLRLRQLELPLMEPAAAVNLSGKWRVSRTGGDVDGFAKAMGASFVLRKAFMAACALLNRARVQQIYAVTQTGNAFTIVVNEGDRMAQHTERFVAAAVGEDGSTAEQSASRYVAHEPWLDTLAGQNVHVAAAKWVGTPGPGAPWPSLWTEVVYQDSGAVAYRAQWMLASEQQLKYTLSRDSSDGWASMWVELALEAPLDAAAGPAPGTRAAPTAAAKKPTAGLEQGTPTPPSVDVGAAGQEGEGESRLATLIRGIENAVATEDYVEAARLKLERDTLTAAGGGGTHELYAL
jgi:hypothetical protein